MSTDSESAKTKTCPNCQQQNSRHALICTYCGTLLTTNLTGTIKLPEQALGTASPDHIQHVTRMYRRALVLFIMEHKQPLLIHNIERYIVLGRSSNTDEPNITIDLNDYGASQLGVSRQHAKITPSHNGYSLQDMNSTNGTWLNDLRLTPNALYILRSGDKMRLGQMTMHIYFEISETTQEAIYLVDTKKTTESLSRHVLTAEDLANVLTPYLRALSDLQGIVDAIMERGTSDVGILRIIISKPGNIIGVTIDGAKDACLILREQVMRWRRDNPELLKLLGDDMMESHKQFTLALVETLRSDYAPERKREAAQKLLPVLQVLLLSSLETTVEQFAMPQA